MSESKLRALLNELEIELKDFKSLPLHGATNEQGWLQARGEVYCMERIIKRLRVDVGDTQPENEEIRCRRCGAFHSDTLKCQEALRAEPAKEK